MNLATLGFFRGACSLPELIARQHRPMQAPRQTSAVRSGTQVAHAPELVLTQRLANASPVVAQLVQLQRAADARPPSGPVMQRKPFIRNAEGQRIDIGPKAMTLGDLITLSQTLDDDAAIETAVAEIQRRRALLPDGQEFAEGMFSGTYESTVDRNWADLHVVGELGGNLDPADLRTIFGNLNEAMTLHHSVSGIPGELEWHPTGAVVTKQIVELLGEALGSWSDWIRARSAKSDRKKADARGDNPERNKLDPKLAPEMVPEHLAYLRSLKGKSGLSIAVGGGMALPEGIEALPVDEQVAALNQSMIDGSEAGDARFAQYEEGLLDDDMPGPSMRIKMHHKHLPKLISKLP